MNIPMTGIYVIKGVNDYEIYRHRASPETLCHKAPLTDSAGELIARLLEEVDKTQGCVFITVSEQ